MAREPDPHADDGRLMRIAAAIAEGTTVEWITEEDIVEDECSGILGGLRSVERIVVAHRRLDFREVDEQLPAAWGHLTILEKIDEGSFGGVYRAHDSRLATDVALKLLTSRETGGPANAARILSEARLLAKVRHPNVVRVYGADDTQRRVGLWMEFIEGCTLEALLAAQGPFGAREAALMGVDVCRAVAAVHRAGLVHGDIKARNVMREEGGRIVLMDFGAGRELTEAQPRTDRLAATPAYVAPEVTEGQPPSTASDIYALGVLLFHLVTREYPVLAATSAEMTRMHRHGQRRMLRDVRPDLPDAFIQIVERAVAVDPRERYASAGALEAALSHLVNPAAPAATPPRWPAVAVWGAVAAALVLSAGIWISRSLLTGGVDRIVDQTPSVASVSTAAASTYEIDAAFYTVTKTGDRRLAEGDAIALNDRLYVRVLSTAPVHVYIVDEPERGQPYLLFPLPGQTPANPLPANQPVRVPRALYWQVTSLGGREHFVVFASREPVDAFEQAFAGLASPRLGESALAARLSTSTAERLRGVGGLVPSAPTGNGGVRFASLFTTPLAGHSEIANGLWIRQLTLQNPPP